MDESQEEFLKGISEQILGRIFTGFLVEISEGNSEEILEGIPGGILDGNS